MQPAEQSRGVILLEDCRLLARTRGMEFPKLADMNDNPDDSVNDPIDDEMEAATMVAAELVARAKRLRMPKLELPIKDEAAAWKVTVSKMEITAYPGSSQDPRNRGEHDGKVK
jgi:hypothetical protein